MQRFLHEETHRLGGKYELFVLGGSSQGCILGLDIYMRHGVPLGGFCGVVGFWPRCSDADLKKAASSGAHRDRPLRLLNGGDDAVVSSMYAKRSLECLKAAGFHNLCAKCEAKLGHHVGKREGEWIRTFLDEVL